MISCPIFLNCQGLFDEISVLVCLMYVCVTFLFLFRNLQNNSFNLIDGEEFFFFFYYFFMVRYGTLIGMTLNESGILVSKFEMAEVFFFFFVWDKCAK